MHHHHRDGDHDDLSGKQGAFTSPQQLSSGQGYVSPSYSSQSYTGDSKHPGSPSNVVSEPILSQYYHPQGQLLSLLTAGSNIPLGIAHQQPVPLISCLFGKSIPIVIRERIFSLLLQTYSQSNADTYSERSFHFIHHPLSIPAPKSKRLQTEGQAPLGGIFKQDWFYKHSECIPQVTLLIGYLSSTNSYLSVVSEWNELISQLSMTGREHRYCLVLCVNGESLQGEWSSTTPSSLSNPNPGGIDQGGATTPVPLPSSYSAPGATESPASPTATASSSAQSRLNYLHSEVALVAKGLKLESKQTLIIPFQCDASMSDPIVLEHSIIQRIYDTCFALSDQAIQSKIKPLSRVAKSSSSPLPVAIRSGIKLGYWYSCLGLHAQSLKQYTNALKRLHSIPIQSYSSESALEIRTIATYVNAQICLLEIYHHVNPFDGFDQFQSFLRDFSHYTGPKELDFMYFNFVSAQYLFIARAFDGYFRMIQKLRIAVENGYSHTPYLSKNRGGVASHLPVSSSLSAPSMASSPSGGSNSTSISGQHTTIGVDTALQTAESNRGHGSSTQSVLGSLPTTATTTTTSSTSGGSAAVLPTITPMEYITTFIHQCALPVLPQRTTTFFGDFLTPYHRFPTNIVQPKSSFFSTSSAPSTPLHFLRFSEYDLYTTCSVTLSKLYGQAASYFQKRFKSASTSLAMSSLLTQILQHPQHGIALLLKLHSNHSMIATPYCHHQLETMCASPYLGQSLVIIPSSPSSPTSGPSVDRSFGFANPSPPTYQPHSILESTGVVSPSKIPRTAVGPFKRHYLFNPFYVSSPSTQQALLQMEYTSDYLSYTMQNPVTSYMINRTPPSLSSTTTSLTSTVITSPSLQERVVPYRLYYIAEATALCFLPFILLELYELSAIHDVSFQITTATNTVLQKMRHQILQRHHARASASPPGAMAKASPGQLPSDFGTSPHQWVIHALYIACQGFYYHNVLKQRMKRVTDQSLPPPISREYVHPHIYQQTIDPIYVLHHVLSLTVVHDDDASFVDKGRLITTQKQRQDESGQDPDQSQTSSQSQSTLVGGSGNQQQLPLAVPLPQFPKTLEDLSLYASQLCSHRFVPSYQHELFQQHLPPSSPSSSSSSSSTPSSQNIIAIDIPGFSPSMTVLSSLISISKFHIRLRHYKSAYVILSTVLANAHYSSFFLRQSQWTLYVTDLIQTLCQACALTYDYHHLHVPSQQHSMVPMLLHYLTIGPARLHVLMAYYHQFHQGNYQPLAQLPSTVPTPAQVSLYDSINITPTFGTLPLISITPYEKYILLYTLAVATSCHFSVQAMAPTSSSSSRVGTPGAGSSGSTTAGSSTASGSGSTTAVSTRANTTTASAQEQGGAGSTSSSSRGAMSIQSLLTLLQRLFILLEGYQEDLKPIYSTQGKGMFSGVGLPYRPYLKRKFPLAIVPSLDYTTLFQAHAYFQREIGKRLVLGRVNKGGHPIDASGINTLEPLQALSVSTTAVCVNLTSNWPEGITVSMIHLIFNDQQYNTCIYHSDNQKLYSFPSLSPSTSSTPENDDTRITTPTHGEHIAFTLDQQLLYPVYDQHADLSFHPNNDKPVSLNILIDTYTTAQPSIRLRYVQCNLHLTDRNSPPLALYIPVSSLSEPNTRGGQASSSLMASSLPSSSSTDRVSGKSPGTAPLDRASSVKESLFSKARTQSQKQQQQTTSSTPPTSSQQHSQLVNQSRGIISTCQVLLLHQYTTPGAGDSPQQSVVSSALAHSSFPSASSLSSLPSSSSASSTILTVSPSSGAEKPPRKPRVFGLKMPAKPIGISNTMLISTALSCLRLFTPPTELPTSLEYLGIPRDLVYTIFRILRRHGDVLPLTRCRTLPPQSEQIGKQAEASTLSSPQQQQQQPSLLSINSPELHVANPPLSLSTTFIDQTNQADPLVHYYDHDTSTPVFPSHAEAYLYATQWSRMVITIQTDDAYIVNGCLSFTTNIADIHLLESELLQTNPKLPTKTLVHLHEVEQLSHPRVFALVSDEFIQQTTDQTQSTTSNAPPASLSSNLSVSTVHCIPVTTMQTDVKDVHHQYNLQPSSPRSPAHPDDSNPHMTPWYKPMVPEIPPLENHTTMTTEILDNDNPSIVRPWASPQMQHETQYIASQVYEFPSPFTCLDAPTRSSPVSSSTTAPTLAENVTSQQPGLKTHLKLEEHQQSLYLPDLHPYQIYYLEFLVQAPLFSSKAMFESVLHYQCSSTPHPDVNHVDEDPSPSPSPSPSAAAAGTPELSTCSEQRVLSPVQSTECSVHLITKQPISCEAAATPAVSDQIRLSTSCLTSLLFNSLIPASALSSMPLPSSPGSNSVRDVSDKTSGIPSSSSLSSSSSPPTPTNSEQHQTMVANPQQTSILTNPKEMNAFILQSLKVGPVNLPKQSKTPHQIRQHGAPSSPPQSQQQQGGSQQHHANSAPISSLLLRNSSTRVFIEPVTTTEDYIFHGCFHRYTLSLGFHADMFVNTMQMIVNNRYIDSVWSHRERQRNPVCYSKQFSINEMRELMPPDEHSATGSSRMDHVKHINARIDKGTTYTLEQQITVREDAIHPQQFQLPPLLTPSLAPPRANSQATAQKPAMKTDRNIMPFTPVQALFQVDYCIPTNIIVKKCPDPIPSFSPAIEYPACEPRQKPRHHALMFTRFNPIAQHLFDLSMASEDRLVSADTSTSACPLPQFLLDVINGLTNFDAKLNVVILYLYTRERIQSTFIRPAPSILSFTTLPVELKLTAPRVTYCGRPFKMQLNIANNLQTSLVMLVDIAHSNASLLLTPSEDEQIQASSSTLSPSSSSASEIHTGKNDSFIEITSQITQNVRVASAQSHLLRLDLRCDRIGLHPLPAVLLRVPQSRQYASARGQETRNFILPLTSQSNFPYIQVIGINQ